MREYVGRFVGFCFSAFLKNMKSKIVGFLICLLYRNDFFGEIYDDFVKSMQFYA